MPKKPLKGLKKVCQRLRKHQEKGLKISLDIGLRGIKQNISENNDFIKKIPGLTKL